MRKLGITLLVIVVLFIAAALIVPRVVDINQYHGQIQTQLERRLGRTVTLGEMRLSLFPPSFQVQNPVIGEDPRFSFNQNRPFATADKLAVSVELLPLLNKDLRVKSLELDRPFIELVRDQKGVWNFATLGEEPKPTPSAEAARKTSPPAQAAPSTGQPAQAPAGNANKPAAGQLTLANLSIVDGQVAITDLQKHQSRAIYDHIDLNVNDFAPDKAFAIKAAAHLPTDRKGGGGKQAIMLHGKGGPIKESDLLSTPFDGKLKLDEVSVAAAQKFLNSQALANMDALVTGEAAVNNSGGKLTSSGNVQLQKPRIKNVDVGYPITLNYDLTDDLTNDVIQIRKGNIRLGQTPVTITGTLNTRPTPTQVDLKLTAANASIAEAARLASAFGIAFGQGMDVKGTVNANITAKGAADKPAMNGQLSASNLDISGKDIPQPVKVPSIDLALTPDTIRSNNFSATTGSTAVNVNFVLSHYTSPNSLIDASLRAPNAKVGEILNIAKAAGVSAAEGISGDGLLTLDVHAQGPTKNMSALAFNGSGKLQNVTLSLPFGQGLDVKGTVNGNISASGAANKLALNGQFSARNLDVSGKDIPQPVKVPSIELALTPDTIRSNDFSATTGSTTVNASFTLNHYTSPNSLIDARVRAPNAKLGEILNIARAADVSAVEGMSGDGLLTLDVHAQGPTKNMSALAFSGSGKLQNATLKLPSLTKPLQVRNADLSFSQNSATLRNLAATIGQTSATGDLTMKNFAAPQVQFALNADKVDVTELQQLVSTTPSPLKRSAAEPDFWRIIPAAQAQSTGAPAPRSSMVTKMTGGGTVAIGTVRYNDLLLNDVRSNVTLDHGIVHLNPVTADLYGGKETGSITIDLRPAQPVYTVALKTNNVDANKLVSSVSDLKQTLYGLLSSNVNASFSSTSANAIARSLNGQLALNLANGKLMNLDLLHELASVGKFLGSPAVPSAPRGFTNVAQLSGNFDVKNGLAQTNNLKAAIDGGTMAAVGLINLADQSLNLHVTAVLNKALSQQVGGNQVGGFMNTALANNQGELVIPVIVTGTFQHPSVAPDLERLAEMKLKNMVPTAKNPGELTTGILGQIFGKRQGNTQNGTTQQPEGGLSGIIGAIGGKQKQPQQQQPNQGVTGNQGQQPQAQPSPTPNPLGDILNQVLKQKKGASPTPTPPR